ncbi:MAG: hypothetical protein LBF65_01535 [Holosporales bacterium]|jgi:hypothetical protein|nr:hypothetical protein [Holosporales bacterium]
MIYLWGDHHCRRCSDELRSGESWKGANGILYLLMMYGVTLIGSICVVINLVEAVSSVLSFETKSDVTRVLSAIFVSSLYLMCPFLHLQSEEKLSRNKILNFKVFSWLVAVITIITCAGFLYCLYSIIVPQIQRDIALEHTIEEMVQILSHENAVHENLDKIICKMNPSMKSSLQRGKIKYTKLNEHEFKLSWRFKTDSYNFHRIRGMLWTVDTSGLKLFPATSEKTFKLVTPEKK